MAGSDFNSTAVLGAGTVIVAGALIGIGVRMMQKVDGIGATLIDLGTTLTELRTTLMGANGSNGLNSEVKGLRSTSQEHAVLLNGLRNALDLITLRLQNIDEDRRHGSPDRRET